KAAKRAMTGEVEPRQYLGACPASLLRGDMSAGNHARADRTGQRALTDTGLDATYFKVNEANRYRKLCSASGNVPSRTSLQYDSTARTMCWPTSAYCFTNPGRRPSNS